MRKLALIIAGVLCMFSVAAHADTVVFKTGVTKVGIVEEETPASVRLRVKDLVMGISRDNFERIEYAAAEKNEELKLKWKAEKEEARKQGAQTITLSRTTKALIGFVLLLNLELWFILRLKQRPAWENLPALGNLKARRSLYR